MRNRLFKLTVGISSALCAIFTVTWITSYSHRISLVQQTKHDTYSLTINRGKTELLWSNWQPLAPGEEMDPNPRFFGTIDWPAVGVLGVYIPRVKDPAHFRGTNAIVTFPTWFLAIIAILPPLSWMLLKRKRKTQPNHCRVCDYDLRATPDRCPECGTPVRFLLLSSGWWTPLKESPRRCRGSSFVGFFQLVKAAQQHRGLLLLS
jgi:hypothetical protein